MITPLLVHLREQVVPRASQAPGFIDPAVKALDARTVEITLEQWETEWVDWPEATLWSQESTRTSTSRPT